MKRLLIVLLMFEAGTPCLSKEPDSAPAYANYFAETKNPELYLRYMGAMQSADRVTHPNLNGQYAMKLQMRFTALLREATLFWDLSPISFNRVRFHVRIPNSKNLPIYLTVRMADSDKRGYFLRYYVDKNKTSDLRSPLWDSASASASADGGWICYEARLPDDIVSIIPRDETKPNHDQLRERAFVNLAMVFEVDQDFSAFGEPISLIVDGLELYSDPD